MRQRVLEEGLARLRRRIDLLMVIASTEERARQFDFTREAVIVNWGHVYVPPRSPIVPLLDLTGKTLAVVREDISSETFRRIGAVSNVRPYFLEVESYAER